VPRPADYVSAVKTAKLELELAVYAEIKLLVDWRGRRVEMRPASFLAFPIEEIFVEVEAAHKPMPSARTRSSKKSASSKSILFVQTMSGMSSVVVL
jgi:hypothetical protein